MQPDAPAPPDPSEGRRRRFPWVSLALMVIAVVGVLTAAGLGIAAGVTHSQNDDQAIADGVVVRSGVPGTVAVDSADDTVHVNMVIPRDAPAWTTSGIFALDPPPIDATQEGRNLAVRRVDCACESSYDSHRLADGSALVHVADVHPSGRGEVRLSTGDLAPASGLLATRSPSTTTVRHLAIAAGIVAGASLLLGLVALVAFIVFLVRWLSARRRRRHPGGYPTPGGYPAPYSPMPYAPAPSTPMPYRGAGPSAAPAPPDQPPPPEAPPNGPPVP